MMVPRALLLAFALLAGCADRRACYEGDFTPCTCNDGKAGYAACDVASDSFGACGHCGSVPRPTETCDIGGTDELLGFLETCADDSECETGYCHNFNAKGPRCSKSCQVDGDCPCPSTGCNNMGVCKAP